MNTYIIEQRISTLADLWLVKESGYITREMTIDDFMFNQWRVPQGTGMRSDKAWIAKKEIRSNTGNRALNRFRTELNDIVLRLGFVSQCYMDFYEEPFVLFRRTNNIDKLFFYRHIESRKGVGLHFGNSELNTYRQIIDYEYSEAFKFLQECRNTIGYVPKLLLLFSALEAMCGKVSKDDGTSEPYSTYNKEVMKEILSNSLYNKLFGKEGIRHKLDHGEMIESAFGKNYVEEIYTKIVTYFNSKYKTNIRTDIVHPMRHFYRNSYHMDLWLKPKHNFEISLQNCTQNCDESTNIKDCDYVTDADIETY